MEINEEPNLQEDSPPLFKSWSGWYLLLVGSLVGLIILFYLFTTHFS